MGREDTNLGDMILVDWRERSRPVFEGTSSSKTGRTRTRRSQSADKSTDRGTGNRAANRIRHQIALKIEAYDRERTKLGETDGAAEIATERTLARLENDIDRLEAQLEEILE